ncbi:RNA methyltransferase [Lentisphaerota bacterium WC36G]|nr:RNA methyltransferase [Lentisphaerae bacterium WC36]
MREFLSKKEIALLKAVQTRHGRKKHNLCIAEGLRCCRDVASVAKDLIKLAVKRDDINVDYEAFNEVDFVSVDANVFKTIAPTVESQGILLLLEKANDTIVEPTDDFIILLDQVGDPGNFGTILRTARAAGLKEIWYTNGSVDPFNDKVIRSAMGSQFVIKLRKFSSLDDACVTAQEFGYNKFFRTDPHGGESCFNSQELFDKSVIVMGSEAHGVADFENARGLNIPMLGDEESLNVAQATTIIMFEYVRRTVENN